MPKEIKPGLIARSVRDIPPLMEFVDGRQPFPMIEGDLANRYQEVVTEYGQYCMSAYQDPRLTDLLFKYLKYVENNQIRITHSDVLEEKEYVYLRRLGNEHAQLCFVVQETKGTLVDHQLSVIEKYGNDESNPWVFDEIVEHYSSFSDEYKRAYRLFKPEDLMDYMLFYRFIEGTGVIFDTVRQGIMREKVGTCDVKEIQARIDALVAANKILSQEFVLD